MCDCEVCKYIRDYENAVEKNDKKFLMEHLDLYLNISSDLEWYEFKLKRIIEAWVKKR